MVVFKDDPEKYNSPEMFLKIQEDMDNVMALVKQLNKMEEEIILNPMVKLFSLFIKISINESFVVLLLVY